MQKVTNPHTNKGVKREGRNNNNSAMQSPGQTKEKTSGKNNRRETASTRSRG